MQSVLSNLIGRESGSREESVHGLPKWRTGRWSLMFSLILAVSLSFSAPVLADKAPQVLVFDTEPQAVSVLSIYETTPENQLDAVSTILKSSKAFFKGAEGFKGLSVLQSEDGDRVVSLTQWADAASYEAFLAQPVEDYASKYSKEDYGAKYGKEQKSGKDGKQAVTLTPAKTAVLELANLQAPSGMVPAIRGKDALVQLEEVAVDESGSLETLIDEVEAALPAVSKMYPAPRSVLLLKAVDGSEAVLMSYWGYAEEFQDLAQIPAVNVFPQAVVAMTDPEADAESTEQAAIAPTVDQHLYRVVNVIAPKPPKPKYNKTYQEYSK